MAIMEAFRYDGIKSMLTAGLGAGLMIGAPAVAGFAIIGAGLSTLMFLVGIGAIAVTAIALFPQIKDINERRNKQYRKQMEGELREWMKNLNVAPIIQVMLGKENDRLYESYRDAYFVDVTKVVPNLENCQKIKEKISDLRERISDLFPDESRKVL
jgi:hypothetical protein